jgi:hypothetical protein
LLIVPILHHLLMLVHLAQDNQKALLVAAVSFAKLRAMIQLIVYGDRYYP